MVKIGIISDTHNLLRPEVLDALQGCEAILHAGDISKQEILEQLGKIAPVYVVRGNNDKDWAEHIPGVLDFDLCGLRVFMTHKKKDLPQSCEAYDLVVYGHSHRYEEKRAGRTLFLNPGSCGPRRFYQDITMAVIEIYETSGQYAVHRIAIPHEAKKGFTRNNIQTGDIDKIIRLVKSGKTVGEIAAALGIEKDLAEQICRLYLTHPGVTAEGIMTKMGL